MTSTQINSGFFTVQVNSLDSTNTGNGIQFNPESIINLLPAPLNFDDPTDWEVDLIQMTTYMPGNGTSLYVTANFVAPSAVGSQNISLLKRIPPSAIEIRQLEYTEKSTVPNWQPLNSGVISSIILEITQPINNQAVYPANPNKLLYPTVATLAFKRRGLRV